MDKGDVCNHSRRGDVVHPCPGFDLDGAHVVLQRFARELHVEQHVTGVVVQDGCTAVTLRRLSSRDFTYTRLYA